MIQFDFKPEALIFDLDGTLLDTEVEYTAATQQVLDPYGHAYTMELKRRVMGGDSHRSARITIEEFDLPMTPDEYLAKRETYLTELFPNTPEISGAGKFLHHAADSGVTLGLATSSHSHLRDLKLANRSWKTLFNQQVCGNDEELGEGKPAPDIFLLCASRLNVEPTRCIAFEDSENGILAAKSAGMYVIAIDSVYTTTEQLSSADMIIRTYDELH